MKLPLLRLPSADLCALCVLIFAVSLGEVPGEDLSARPAQASELCCSFSRELTYIGAYLSDGAFSANPRAARLDAQRMASLTRPDSGLVARPKEVPSFVDLHPRERIVANYAPPAHAKKGVKKRFFLADLRDQLLTVVYGREKSLQAPQHVAEDHLGRIIVSDPGSGAVHVLGTNAPFRIVGGEKRRLHVPTGVSVDAENNIYVADSDRGVIVVYDSDGVFLREIGKLGNESFFHSPRGIAVDASNGRLYVVDPPRDALFTLDLKGNVLSRVGRDRGYPIGRYASPPIDLDLHGPTEVALGTDKLVVLDSIGSRILLMDLQCNLLGQFTIRTRSASDSAVEVGVGVDSRGSVYVTDSRGSSIRVYDGEGHMIGSFGQWGYRAGEFNAPTGLLIDSLDRAYVADTNNHRVQIFQLGNRGSKAVEPYR